MGLLPVRLKTSYPVAPGTSDDADVWGLCDNGQEYCIKTISKTPYAPGPEWFCHRVAELCGITTAQFDKITMLDGRYCLWLNARWRGHRSEIEHGCTHGKDYWQFASGKIFRQFMHWITSSTTRTVTPVTICSSKRRRASQ